VRTATDVEAGWRELLDLIDWLDERGCKPTLVHGASDRWSAHCPAHTDAHKSLSVGLRDDGAGPVINCYAGCDYEIIVAEFRTERGSRVARRFARRATSAEARARHVRLMGDAAV
jgi:hypothetical protein